MLASPVSPHEIVDREMSGHFTINAKTSATQSISLPHHVNDEIEDNNDDMVDTANHYRH